jgi:hypothetical protein
VASTLPAYPRCPRPSRRARAASEARQSGRQTGGPWPRARTTTGTLERSPSSCRIFPSAFTSIYREPLQNSSKRDTAKVADRGRRTREKCTVPPRRFRCTCRAHSGPSGTASRERAPCTFWDFQRDWSAPARVLMAGVGIEASGDEQTPA